MTAHTETVYLVANIDSHTGKKRFIVSEFDYSHSDEYTVIGEQEVTFDIPSVEVVNGKLIVGLREKIDKMQATATAAINEVEGQIQSLLALENQGEEA